MVISTILLLHSSFLLVKASDYVSPVRIGVMLAGNFGEPRTNHLHQGIDVKTNMTTGHTVCSVADGYVSRIAVGYGGFGLAVYVTHPSGIVSVYCHLKSFRSDIQRYFDSHSFAGDNQIQIVDVPSNVIPVSAGTPIALSGNTGASKAPHLHLEFHDAMSDALIDPLQFLHHLVADVESPVAEGLMAYMFGDYAIGTTLPVRRVFPLSQNGLTRLGAWGKVGFAVAAYDKASGLYNRLGVKQIVLSMDGDEIFRSDLVSFSPLQSRLVNSFVDYDYFRRFNIPYIRSFIEPGNTLPFIRKQHANGIVDISKERTYRFEYRLSDINGNSSIYRFEVDGSSKYAIKSVPHEASKLIVPYGSVVVQFPGYELRFPKGSIYGNVCPCVRLVNDTSAGLVRIKLTGISCPLSGWATLSVLKDRMCIVPHNAIQGARPLRIEDEGEWLRIYFRDVNKEILLD